MDGGWEVELRGWTREMRAARRRGGTIRLRLTHLRQLARANPEVGPWDLTRDDLIGWMAAGDRSPAYQRSIRSSIVGFYAWGEHAGRIRTSPAATLPSVSVPRGTPRPADDDVIRQALAIAPARTLLMLRLMAECGLRRAETASVDTRRVEWAGLRVIGKGGKTRVVPLPRDLRALLEQLPPGPVFPGRDQGHLSPGWVGRLVSGVLPDGVTPHMLRHAAATAWHELGLDLTEIRDLLGHASVATTEVYVAVRSEPARRVVEAAAARFHRPAPARVRSLPAP